MPSGSRLVLSHGTADATEPEKAERADFCRSNLSDRQVRSHEQVLAFFDGSELFEPGLVPTPRRRPDGRGPDMPDHRALIHAGVARKPRRAGLAGGSPAPRSSGT